MKKKEEKNILIPILIGLLLVLIVLVTFALNSISSLNDYIARINKNIESIALIHKTTYINNNSIKDNIRLDKTEKDTRNETKISTTTTEEQVEYCRRLKMDIKKKQLNEVDVTDIKLKFINYSCREILEKLRLDRETCNKYKDQYAIKTGESWGSASHEIQDSWASMKCDTLVLNSVYRETCNQYKDQYSIKNGHAWGFATAEVQSMWKNMSCDTLVPLYDKNLDPIYSLQSNYTEEKSSIIWRVITGYASDERRKNVERMLNFNHSPIYVMNEYKGDSDRCIKFLYQKNIRINPKYYDGLGLIQVGKLGHWCSFLNFLVILNSSTAEIGIWIEDDADLKPNHINEIKSYIYSKDILPSRPLTRVSIADTVLVIQKLGIQSLWNPVVEIGILFPTDIFYKNLALVIEKDLNIPRINNNNSTISTTSYLNISDVNRIISKQKKHFIKRNNKTVRAINPSKNLTKLGNETKRRRQRKKQNSIVTELSKEPIDKQKNVL